MTNIISSAGIQRELDTHYSIAILPFLIVACLDSFETYKILTNKALKRLYHLTLFLTISSFLGYARISYFSSRYFPRYQEALALNRVKSLIPLESSVLTNDNYISHFANRELVIPIERNKLPVFFYDHIVMPQTTNRARIAGKLMPVTGTNLENQIYKVLHESKTNGMKCDESSPYVIHCQNDD